jgi:hypothetical protein
MATLDSAEAAQYAMAEDACSLATLLADRTPVVQLADVNSRTFWRLRTGLPDDRHRAR